PTCFNVPIPPVDPCCGVCATTSVSRHTRTWLLRPPPDRYSGALAMREGGSPLPIPGPSQTPVGASVLTSRPGPWRGLPAKAHNVLADHRTVRGLLETRTRQRECPRN